MDLGGSDSSSPREEARRLWPCSCGFFDGICQSYGINGRKLKSYSLLTLLFKSEALYLLHTCYVGLLVASHPDGDISFSPAFVYWLPSLWLIKPLFALLDDYMDRILQLFADCCRRINGVHDTTMPPSARNRSVMDSLVDLNRHANLLLCLSHIGIVTLLPAVMVYSYLHPLSGGCGPYLVTALALCQIASGAVSDGVFCRYAQCNNELSEVQFASLRLLFITGYGVWNMLSVFMPYPRTTDILSSFMALVNLVPCFLLGNSICVLWVLLCDPGSYEEAVDMNKRAKTSWSPKVAFAFVALMIMAMAVRHPYDCVLLRVSDFQPVTVISLLVLTVTVKVIVSCILARYVSLNRMLVIAKYVFLACLVVNCGGPRILPVPSQESSIWYISLVAVLSTVLHQVLMTFGLVMSVRSAPRGWEATVTSLSDLSLDVVTYAHRNYISPRKAALHLMRYDILVDSLTVFFCLYSLFIIFGKTEMATLLQKESLDSVPSPQAVLPLPIHSGDYPSPSQLVLGDMHVNIPSSVVNARHGLEKPDEDKSPWAAESDDFDRSG
ncbi:uncharacterized protein BXIN_0320 [Babesia sp. Xinjiang]|uniref:uncharacterized protein n=1 Tax=Babesia sp. Xinjiang TaxID=462227 RepID=UPI000A23BED6|nr:uncharacterized protein BXIN_0287 [Babesia sp. Xinjiang]XP_028871595.1 uncharacterized protein BXIN_0320 [Babesia sp. Xinjiang]ORM41093.1 hypothetical protein BXIN_0287 [Babesia sp. Xinjiang]ORM41139.1 hypothetical protein BXIN_0320 [Babesia sp. Xinjiang]